MDLRQIIHKYYFGTDLTEMKVDDKGQVAYHGKRAAEFHNISDSERDKEVDMTTRKVTVMLEYHIFSCHRHISSPTSGTNIDITTRNTEDDLQFGVTLLIFFSWKRKLRHGYF